MLKQGSEDVDLLFSKLVAAYPELTAEAVLPDLVKKERKNRSGKNIGEIWQKLFASVVNAKWFKDYTNEEVN